MTKTPATASGPLEFTDRGAQFVLPLSSLFFDATGALKIDSPLYAAHKAHLDGWLGYLRKQGLIEPAPQPPPAQAMVVSAKSAGTAGNNISLAFSNVHEDTTTHETVFDATVTETDTYVGLTPASIKNVLGASPGGGTKPGLVYVSSAGAPTQPVNGTYQLAGTGPYTADVLDASSAVAFTVRSKSDDAEALHTKIEIKDAADPQKPGTFTLVATWTKPAATGIKPADLQGRFAYEITVTPPPGGQLRAPAAGTVVLRGGSDASGPTTAAVTVPAAG